ncbi:ABC transporter permease subunit [Aquicoccus sp. SCR17]|nr:ABC transporter permease subunit [Carideicomes alvinocaridis]
MSPLLVVMVIGVGAPCLLLLVMSFWQQESYDMAAGWGLGNYVKFFQTPFYQVLVLRSIGVALSVCALTVLMAYPVAYFVAFHVTRYRSLWLVLLTVPFWTSYLLRIFAWKVVLGYNGVINSGLVSLGVIDEPLSVLLYNPLAVTITLTHAWMPFVVLPIYVSLAKIPTELLASASDLGDGPVRRFLRVILPLSIPGVASGAMLVFIPTVGDYVAPMLVGGTSGSMIGTVIAAQFGAADNWPMGSAMSVISMLAVSLTAIAMQFGIMQVRSRAR